MAKQEKVKGALDLPVYVPTEEERRKARKIEEQWRASIEHKTAHNLYEEWAEAERFWNADQWPAPTKATRNLPRPVSNQYAEIIEQKVSALLYDKPEIFFEPVEAFPDSYSKIPVEPLDMDRTEGLPTDIDGAEALSHLAKHQSQTPYLNLNGLLADGCLTAAMKGPMILFFPWDNSIVGGGQNSLYKGDIVGYNIDPANFHLGNPREINIQKQPWLIYEERVPLEFAKTFYSRFGKAVDTLNPEEQAQRTYDREKMEIRSTDYVDLLHCWKKIQDHEVITLDDGTSKITKAKSRVEYTVICQEKVLRDEENISPDAMLYPFVMFLWKPNGDWAWGKSESRDIIKNQKELNRLAGTTLMAAYGTGVPNLRYKPEFVQKKDLPDAPGGGKIPDSSPPGAGWGVDFMRPPAVQPYIGQVRETLKQDNRDTAGVHEAFIGKNPVGGQLNASALIALQEAAGIRMRGIQDRLCRCLIDVGRIWLAHWKQNYKEDRLIRITGDGEALGCAWFNMTHIKDMEFDVKAKAGAGSPYSRTLYMTFLDRLFYEGQVIDAEEYLELVPADIFPKAGTILRKRNEKIQRQQEMIRQAQSETIRQLVSEIMQQAQASGVAIDEQAMQAMFQMAGTIAMQGQQMANAPAMPLEMQGQQMVPPGAMPPGITGNTENI